MVVLSGSWGSFCQHWFGSMHDHSACVQCVVVCDAGSRFRFPHECRPTRWVIGCVCLSFIGMLSPCSPVLCPVPAVERDPVSAVQCILDVHPHFQHTHHQLMLGCLNCTVISLRCMLPEFGLVDPFQHACLTPEADRSR